MSKKNDSQTQQEGQQDSRNDANNQRTSDPFAFMFSGFDTWAQVAGQMAEQMTVKTTREHIDRMQSFYNEMADFENVAYGRAKKSAQDVGDMMSESITYMADLGREWRKLTVEATRRSAEMFGPRS